MIRPNELRAPGEAAAVARLEELSVRLDRLTFGTLAPTPGVEAPPADRDERIAEVEALADRRGLGDLLDEARSRVEGAMMARLGYGARSAGLFGITIGNRADDEARLVVAILDAAAVAVVQDLLDPDAAEALAGPAWRVLGMPSPRRAGADASSADPAPDPGPRGAPTARDWAEAAGGVTEVDPGATPAGSRGLRTAAFVIVTLGGVPVAIAAGLANGQPLLGVAGAAALVALCWTFATAGRR